MHQDGTAGWMSNFAETRTGSTTGESAVSAFARENAMKLEALVELLSALPDAAYAEPNHPASGASIGAHVRHVIDFYGCLLAGAQRGVVDYERRDRDSSIETDRAAAITRLGSLHHEILALSERDDRTLELLSVDLDGETRRAKSSLLRELDAAMSHSVHHFAVVALLLRLRGFAPPDEFGVAPSTLRYRSRQGSS